MPRWVRAAAFACLATATLSSAGAARAVVPGDGETPPPRGEPARAPARWRFPVVFHVAPREDGAPLFDRPTLERALRDAARPFAPARIDFYVHDVRALPAENRIVDDIPERRALRRRFVPRVINVFVAYAIRDPHPSASMRRAAAAQGRTPTGWISGAHIPSARGRRPATYLLVSGRTRLWSLSHELGHFFGAVHVADPTNIMSYGRDRRSFDADQLGRFERRAERYARRRVLRPILAPGDEG